MWAFNKTTTMRYLNVQTEAILDEREEKEVLQIQACKRHAQGNALH
jgi:hypothetical protein